MPPDLAGRAELQAHVELLVQGYLNRSRQPLQACAGGFRWARELVGVYVEV